MEPHALMCITFPFLPYISRQITSAHIMKSISSLLAAVLLSSVFYNATAQVVTKGSHHFYLGYAPASKFKFSDYGGIFGPVVAGYRFALGKRITLGAEFGYSHGNTGTYSYRRHIAPGIVTITDSRKYTTYNTGIRFDYHYLNRTKLDVYSGVMLEGLWTYHKYKVYPAYNYDYGLASVGLCVAGCRYMVHPKLGVFGELTFREMGYGVIGVSARLGKAAGNDAQKK